MRAFFLKLYLLFFPILKRSRSNKQTEGSQSLLELEPASNQTERSNATPRSDINFEPPEPPVTLFSSLISLFRLGLPLTISWLVVRGADTISLSFIKELHQPIYTASAGLANLIIQMVIAFPVYGIATVLDTLLSQSYGQKNYKLFGSYYNKGTIIILVSTLILSPILAGTKQILLFLKYSEDTATLTVPYASILLVYIAFWMQYTAIQKFLTTQKVVWPQLIILTVAHIGCIAWNYIFMFCLNIGFYGAAIGRSFASLTSFVAGLVYIRRSQKYTETVVPYTREVFQGWQSLLALGLPSVAMNCLSGWSIQGVFLMIGVLTKNEQAATMALSNLGFLYNSLPSGLATAVAVSVGHCIGAGDIWNAKLYFKSSLLANFLLCFFIGLPILVFPNIIASLYFVEEEPKKIMSNQMLLFIIQGFLLNIQVVLRGVLLGMGKQGMATVANIICFNIIMLPLAYFLLHTFTLGPCGIWIAFSVGYGTVCGAYLIIIFTADWEELVTLSQKRLQNDAKSKEKQVEKQKEGELKIN